MGIFNDFHQLSEGLRLIERLTEVTQNLVIQCEKLNNNIEQLTAELKQQKQAKNKFEKS